MSGRMGQSPPPRTPRPCPFQVETSGVNITVTSRSGRKFGAVFVRYGCDGHRPEEVPGAHLRRERRGTESTPGAIAGRTRAKSSASYRLESGVQPPFQDETRGRFQPSACYGFVAPSEARPERAIVSLSRNAIPARRTTGRATRLAAQLPARCSPPSAPATNSRTAPSALTSQQPPRRSADRSL
jgi:hypothetical protein